MPKVMTDPEVRLLAGLASTLEIDYQQDDVAWAGSPFAWIRSRPSRQRGKIGEQLVAGWCAAHDLDVLSPPDSNCDRMLAGLRAEIKFSTWWAQGGYTFQQFRNQAYDVAICLGISPFDAHCWTIPKTVLLQNVIGHLPQHTGAGGTDTFWIQSLDPANVPAWLAPYGGRLQQALEVLRTLSKSRR